MREKGAGGLRKSCSFISERVWQHTGYGEEITQLGTSYKKEEKNEGNHRNTQQETKRRGSSPLLSTL